MLLTYRALVLFDIDGTLVRRAGPHHREALVQGIRRVTGLETTTEGIPVQGMLDPDILTIMMRRAGVPRAQIREAMPDILRASERYYLRVCPPLHDKHCPGVAPLLERLTRRGILLGLVTGNLTRIGWRKLERAGLRDYFRFGAFGEMAKTRAGLAKMAIRESHKRSWIDRQYSHIADRRFPGRCAGGAKQPHPRHRGSHRPYACRRVAGRRPRHLTAGPPRAPPQDGRSGINHRLVSKIN